MALDWLCPAPALPAWCRDGLSLREAAAAEMDAVYLMGRDAWGTAAAWLSTCGYAGIRASTGAVAGMC